jgi:hypothetical protein
MRNTIAVSVLAAVVLAQALTPLPSPAAGPTQRSKPAAASTAGQALHRVDFRIEGASCVACLRRIAKAMRETKGILKADVSIFRPYWAIAIYDAKQADFPKLQRDISAKENVRFMEIEDKGISEMPLIVIPKVSSAQSKSPAVKAAVGAAATSK